MTDGQLFTEYGYVRPAAGSTGTRRLKASCREPGCTAPTMFGSGHHYCADHNCDADDCCGHAVERGRCKRHAYCAVEGCTSTRRQVAAARYCDEHATCVAYELTGTAGPPTLHTGLCLACDEEVTQRRAYGEQAAMFLCGNHRGLRQTMKDWRHKYNLDDERIRELVIGARCIVCKRDLRWRFNVWANKVDIARKVHVDHDHACCPGVGSCGKCVRGLVHAKCNTDLGHLEALMNDLGAEALHALVDELITIRSAMQ